MKLTSGEVVMAAGEPTWWALFEKLLDERFDAVVKQFANGDKALALQATEYERRLEDLNHAHARAQAALNTFVSIEKYEDKMEAEAEARKLALAHLESKIEHLDINLSTRLEDYITKAEQREAERDQAIALQEGAAQEAQRAAEAQGRKSDEQARELARKTNRNMAVLGVVVAIIIAVSNWFGSASPPTPPTTPTPTVTTTIPAP